MQDVIKVVTPIKTDITVQKQEQHIEKDEEQKLEFAAKEQKSGSQLNDDNNQQNKSTVDSNTNNKTTIEHFAIPQQQYDNKLNEEIQNYVFAATGKIRAIYKEKH